MNIQPWISVRHAALSELTLVILTYNRPAMVQRLLRYLHKQAPEITLLLLDHGDAESQESNAAAVAGIAPSIRHLRLPVEIHHTEVLIAGCAEITTPYSAFCPDDDIPVIDGIVDAMSMLIVNQNMVCVQGYILSLTESDSAMYFGPFEDYVPSYDDQEPLKRLFNMMRRYQPCFWGFYRTEILVRVTREFVSANNSNLMFHEFFHAALVCSRGAIGRSPSISLWRRVAGSHTDRRKIHPFHQLIDSPSQLGTDYLAFRERLLPYYLDEAQADAGAQESGIRRLIDLIFMQFLVRHINYAELEAKISDFLEDPNHDYFSTLTVQEANFDAGSFLPFPDLKDDNVDVLVSHEVLVDAAQVSQEFSMGTLNRWREKKVTTEMLSSAIRAALDYRSNG